jgi:hypothetical protein
MTLLEGCELLFLQRPGCGETFFLVIPHETLFGHSDVQFRKSS